MKTAVEIEGDNPQLLTVKDAAKVLAISERSLFSLTAAGRIRAVRIGPRCVRYELTDLHAFIQNCKGAL